jgi:hypothetical protein
MMLNDIAAKLHRSTLMTHLPYPLFAQCKQTTAIQSISFHRGSEGS